MRTLLLPLVAAPLLGAAPPAQLLVEAEGFDRRGGWVLDTQFVEIVGSPYLLAHGLGRPVADATTTVEVAAPGPHRLWVRTKDWVARWGAEGAPGRFQVRVDGRPADAIFGASGAEWAWQDGGVVQLGGPRVELALRDLTGFDGRCDALYLTPELDAPPPPDGAEVLPAWRRALLGLPEHPIPETGYDLVVVGGGYAGMAASISAARMGCKVALIQNRGVLGGNGSSEVRVWAMGLIRRGPFPHIGEIVEEFADSATKSPGRYEEFGDEHKERVVRAEPNLSLFLNHHAYAVDTADGRIEAVVAFDTRTSARRRFEAPLFCDATGHGTIGFLAGADYEIHDGTLMGMSNMWRWANAEGPREFSAEPWALDLEMEDFPYPRDFHGQWFWESGYQRDPIADLEYTRDWNLRAVYGAFHAMKNRGGAEAHRNAELTWLAFIGGPRESRRLMGDVVLTSDDITEKRDFPDGCVPSTWSIDLHYPKEQYAKKFPDDPFISIAVHDRRVDRNYGYPVPYRCFYSRNVPNLFMAGRNISVTHEALGTTRVMKTCGMMGEVVGKAAAICTLRGCDPRGVYSEHLDELKSLMELPGSSRRATVRDEIVVGEVSFPGLDPGELGDGVVDDRAAWREGPWTEGTGLDGFIGHGYLYAGTDSGAVLRYELEAPEAGTFDVRIAYRHHENRGPKVPVALRAGDVEIDRRLDMREEGALGAGFVSLGELELEAGGSVVVTLSTEGAGGYVCADAAALVAVD